MLKQIFKMVVVLLAVGVVIAAASAPNLVGNWIGNGKVMALDGNTYDFSIGVDVANQQGPLFQGRVWLSGGLFNDNWPMTGHVSTSKDVNITFGPNGSSPAFAWINGKWTGKTVTGVFHGLEEGTTGYFSVGKTP
jgi:hypothetical protein